MSKSEVIGPTERDEDRIVIEGTKPLKIQVAGHKFGENKRKIGMLDYGNGLILKALQDPPRGTRELNFYSTVYDPLCQDPDMLELRNFLPGYHGTEKRNEVTFIKLENAAVNFNTPSIVDIKMGRQTSDPEATKEKAAHEKAKCPAAEKIGFQLSGMMVYNPIKEDYDRMDKYSCHKLTEQTVLTDGLGKFFGLHHKLRKDVIQVTLEKLKPLEKWFLSQKRFAFYASSILIIYESAKKVANQNQLTSCISTADKKCGESQPESPSECQSPGSVPCSVAFEKSHNTLQDGTNNILPVSSHVAPQVETKLIDFAHVFPAKEVDENYLYGLQMLIKYLQTLLDM